MEGNDLNLLVAPANLGTQTMQRTVTRKANASTSTQDGTPSQIQTHS